MTWKADILVDPFGVSLYDNDESEVPAKFETKTGGSIEITRGNSSQTFKITKGDGEVSNSIFADSDGEQYSFSAVWTSPYEMYDQEVTFEWDVKVGATVRRSFLTGWPAMESGSRRKTSADVLIELPPKGSKAVMSIMIFSLCL